MSEVMCQLGFYIFSHFVTAVQLDADLVHSG